MTPTVDNLIATKGIYKGRDFSRIYNAKDSAGDPIDITAYTIEAQIREELNRTADVIASFTVTNEGANGRFTISLTDTQTDALAETSGFYDILVQDAGGLRAQWVIGEIDIQETVTVT